MAYYCSSPKRIKAPDESEGQQVCRPGCKPGRSGLTQMPMTLHGGSQGVCSLLTMLNREACEILCCSVVWP